MIRLSCEQDSRIAAPGDVLIQPPYACYLCGLEVGEQRVKLGDFRVIECQNCGLGVTSPLPTAEEVIEHNKSVYAIDRRIKAYKSRSRELNRRYIAQLKAIQQIQRKPGTRLLDIGCSAGFFLAAARERGYDAYGVEIAENTAQYAREQLGLNVFCGPLESAGHADGYFDVVTMWDVLEHTLDPKRILREVWRILGEDGLLVVQSPNMESMMAEMTGERWHWWCVPDHLYHFTPSSITRLLQESGFEIISMFTWEPSTDLLSNLLESTLRLNPKSRHMGSRVLRKIVHLACRVGHPLIIPAQKAAWKHQRGALVLLLARKSAAYPPSTYEELR